MYKKKIFSIITVVLNNKEKTPTDDQPVTDTKADKEIDDQA